MNASMRQDAFRISAVLVAFAACSVFAVGCDTFTDLDSVEYADAGGGVNNGMMTNNGANNGMEVDGGNNGSKTNNGVTSNNNGATNNDGGTNNGQVTSCAGVAADQQWAGLSAVDVVANANATWAPSWTNGSTGAPPDQEMRVDVAQAYTGSDEAPETYIGVAPRYTSDFRGLELVKATPDLVDFAEVTLGQEMYDKFDLRSRGESVELVAEPSYYSEACDNDTRTVFRAGMISGPDLSWIPEVDVTGPCGDPLAGPVALGGTAEEPVYFYPIWGEMDAILASHSEVGSTSSSTAISSPGDLRISAGRTLVLYGLNGEEWHLWDHRRADTHPYEEELAAASLAYVGSPSAGEDCYVAGRVDDQGQKLGLDFVRTKDGDDSEQIEVTSNVGKIPLNELFEGPVPADIDVFHHFGYTFALLYTPDLQVGRVRLLVFDEKFELKEEYVTQLPANGYPVGFGSSALAVDDRVYVVAAMMYDYGPVAIERIIVSEAP